MKIEYRQAGIEDAELLVNIYNASFYDDYVRYGSCPGYGQTKEMMEESISKYRKHIILYDNEPVGCISCIKLDKGVYEVGCLCVIPEYQGKGIGTQAIRFVKTSYEDWERLTLVTPIDKKENVKFYTEKCGFRIESTERDGDVELVRFVAEKKDSICIKPDLNEVYKSVLEADRAAIVICDLDHKIIYMNPSAINRYEKWGGRTLMGQSLLNCHNDKSREMIIKVLDWFKASKNNNIVYTSYNEKENKDVYMVALRNGAGELIAYYEKHEYRDRETMKMYDI